MPTFGTVRSSGSRHGIRKRKSRGFNLPSHLKNEVQFYKKLGKPIPTPSEVFRIVLARVGFNTNRDASQLRFQPFAAIAYENFGRLRVRSKIRPGWSKASTRL